MNRRTAFELLEVAAALPVAEAERLFRGYPHLRAVALRRQAAQCNTSSVQHCPMPNLTITVDEDTLRRARIRALERHESVNAYLAEMLRRYADDSSQAQVFAELAEIAGSLEPVEPGHGRTWTRDQLHRV